MIAETKKDGLIYVYALVPTTENNLIHLNEQVGIDSKNYISLKELGPMTAVICELDSEKFSVDNIEENTQDPKWLSVKATHHHEVVSLLHTHCTVVPLKFCTIYSNMNSLRQELEQKQDKLMKLLTRFKKRDGWNVKIYCQKEKWFSSLEEQDPTILKQKEKIAKMPPGTQFLMKKKLKQTLIASVDQHIEQEVQKVHDLLLKSSDHYNPKKIWNKQVTGKPEEMVWSGVYLVHNEEAIENFRKIIENIQLDLGQYGVKIDLTGPWPPYDFLDIDCEEIAIE
ncbi:GvpL/GvpF family gas vesicle protein [Alkalihalobacterium chitinilyticum]|uniref:GvpL/GvpF family gas vesicle protein n=1 Tax=Alkalihalobacterium chitinilyticum TaxID=2980103 RepID=A0ABT5VDW8_9BACI|nr:GvpL/GvpF family gas vesicle protein [Alkalihalobacterium chitinilyticum]MDE5413660.1 GvpL/GvpF family gas vesicle protein [Alkalihalobacterium chitinilyticum]